MRTVLLKVSPADALADNGGVTLARPGVTPGYIRDTVEAEHRHRQRAR